jgi:hypothetical protein
VPSKEEEEELHQVRVVLQDGLAAEAQVLRAWHHLDLRPGPQR